jgi:dTDP-4-dehydrorhamnose reductase
VKILVTGAAGMLAHDLVPVLLERGHEVVPLDRAALDVTDAAAVEERLVAERPDYVVQCAAYTAVDDAERDEAAAYELNAEATAHVARACQKIGARLVYPSTDYVFSGESDRPYRPEDPTVPINAYGRSKLAGERAALEVGGSVVVRTSWLYGAGGRNFVDTIIRLAGEKDTLEVVADQIGRPTWTADLSEIIAELMERGVTGIVHATGAADPTSWHGFATEVVALSGARCRVDAISSDRFPRPARRPANSVLDCTATEAAVERPLRGWRDALAQYLRSGTEGR